jgi:hypothetical protein
LRVDRSSVVQSGDARPYRAKYAASSAALELAQLALVGVGLRCVDPRVTEERAKCADVPTAFSQEAVGEAVAQLMRGKDPHTRAVADALHHPPQRLLARRNLRILPSSDALVLRNELRVPRGRIDGMRQLVIGASGEYGGPTADPRDSCQGP